MDATTTLAPPCSLYEGRKHEKGRDDSESESKIVTL